MSNDEREREGWRNVIGRKWLLINDSPSFWSNFRFSYCILSFWLQETICSQQSSSQFSLSLQSTSHFSSSQHLSFPVWLNQKKIWLLAVALALEGATSSTLIPFKNFYLKKFKRWWLELLIKQTSLSIFIFSPFSLFVSESSDRKEREGKNWSMIENKH